MRGARSVSPVARKNGTNSRRNPRACLTLKTLLGPISGSGGKAGLPEGDVVGCRVGALVGCLSPVSTLRPVGAAVVDAGSASAAGTGSLSSEGAGSVPTKMLGSFSKSHEDTNV